MATSKSKAKGTQTEETSGKIVEESAIQETQTVAAETKEQETEEKQVASVLQGCMKEKRNQHQQQQQKVVQETGQLQHTGLLKDKRPRHCIQKCRQDSPCQA